MAAAKDAGKDWERERMGGPVCAANASSDGECDVLGRVGEVEFKVVVVR